MTASTKDGTFAWVLCAACFFNTTMVGGFILTSGIFYIMFRDSLDATDSQVSLIPAINVGVMHAICPFAGMLSERYGTRCVAMTGAALSTAGLALGSFSTRIYHLYINFGLVAGLGLGMIMNCSLSILNPHFEKYKRTACGLAMTGFGVGSFIFPPILKHLEDVYGWRGAILLLAGMNVHMLLSSILFRPFKAISPQIDSEMLNENAPHWKKEEALEHSEKLHKSENSGIKKRFDNLQYGFMKVLSLFKIIPFLCPIFLALIHAFGLSIVLTHFGTYVSTLGYSSTDIVRLYMTLGITSTIARLLTGVLSQASNANGGTVVMLTMLLNGILTLCVPFMNQLWMLYSYAICFQILITPFNIFQAVLIMEHVPKQQVAVAIGIVMLCYVPGYTLGGPMGVWLHEYTHVYGHTFFLAGGIILLGGLTMAPAAFYIHRTRHGTPSSSQKQSMTCNI